MGESGAAAQRPKLLVSVGKFVDSACFWQCARSESTRKHARITGSNAGFPKPHIGSDQVAK